MALLGMFCNLLGVAGTLVILKKLQALSLFLHEKAVCCFSPESLPSALTGGKASRKFS